MAATSCISSGDQTHRPSSSAWSPIAPSHNASPASRSRFGFAKHLISLLPTQTNTHDLQDSTSNQQSSTRQSVPEQRNIHDHSRSQSSYADPPPLAQALENAIVQEFLQVPTKAVQLSLRKRGTQSHSPSRSLPQSGPGSNEHVQALDQLEEKDTSDASLVIKLLIITHDGYVLQYSQTGSPDRLPEKVLQFRPGTIAVASDTLPGKHWVLNIVRDARGSESRGPFSLKSLRPLLLARNSERRLQVQELFLVFETPSSFDRWLVTARKQIQALGGLEYRPDSRGLVGELRRFKSPAVPASCETSTRFFSAPVAFPLAESQVFTDRDSNDSPSQSPLSRRSPAPSLRHESITDSSVESATDLDLLRESLVSEHSLAGTRSSSGVSLHLDSNSPCSIASYDTSPSPLEKTSKGGSTTSSRPKKFTPEAIFVDGSDRTRASSCSPAVPSPQFPRTPTLPTDTVHNMARKFASVSSGEVHSPVEAGKMADWLKDLIKGRNGRIGFPTPPQSPQSPPQDHDQQKEASLEQSFDETGVLFRVIDWKGTDDADLYPTAAPPAYTLAPTRRSSVDATQQRPRGVASPPDKDKASSVPDILFSPRSFPRDAEQEARTDAQQKDMVKQLHRNGISIVANHNHLLIDQIHKAERSPAVNDTHLATCFGVETPYETQSIQIGGESLDFPLTGKMIELPPSPMLQQALDLPVKRPTTPQQKKKKNNLARQRSLPNIMYGVEAPLSQPPSIPLPAVPTQLSRPPTTPRGRHVKVKSVSPKWTESFSAGDNESQRRGSSTRSGMSPLGSNPVSSAKMGYAGKLSASLSSSPTRPRLQRAPATVAGDLQYIPTLNRNQQTTTGNKSNIGTTRQLIDLDWPRPPHPGRSHSVPLLPAAVHPSRSNSVPVLSTPSLVQEDMMAAIELELKGYPFPSVIQTLDK